MRRRWSGTAILSVVLFASACVSSAGTPATPGPPAIYSFSASHTAGPSPLTTAFSWNIAVPETSFTCSLDLDDDGVFEVVVDECTSTSIRSATFSSPGSHPVRLRVTDGDETVTSAPVTLTVAPPSPDPYDVTFRFGPGLSVSQIAAFNSAATRLASMVKTGLADTTIDIGADHCVTGTDPYSGPVDDVLIDALVTPIDGAAGTLAQAGPCAMRSGGGLTAYGVVKFDSADVAGLESSGRLEDVILHEIVHVLGFGLRWDSSLLLGAGSSDPRYVGPVARGAWNEIAGPAAVVVPVEADGGPGTAYSHWREVVLDNELMTGYIDAGSNPLSTVSIGALADLGYG
ncbi:MAG: leishmanolysin-related zinc metalloendopeptidase, partial [Microthrixaceae bacterium]